MPNVLTESPNILSSHPAYANAMKRLGARCIDWVIVSIIGALLLVLFCGNLNIFASACVLFGLSTSVPAMPLFGVCLEYYFVCATIRHEIQYVAWFLIGVPVLVECLYYTLFESSQLQATLGKKLFKIKVVDNLDQRLSIPKAFFRYWAKSVCTVLLLAGPIGPTAYCAYRIIISVFITLFGLSLVAITSKRQCLHDMITKTFCIVTC